MSLDMQIDTFNEEEVVLAVFIEHKPVYWTAKVMYKDVPTDPTKQFKTVLYQPFIFQAINKFTDVEVTAENINEKLADGLNALKSITDLKSIIRIHYATVAMANSLLPGIPDDDINSVLKDYE